MNQPLRVLMDTSAYDTYLATADFDRLVKAIGARKVIVYGFKTVREELRAIPTTKKIGTKGLRSEILHTYDQLVGDHLYQASPFVERLAQQYDKEYQGNYPRKEMRNDFLIVACAAFHQLNILVTQDRRTMMSEAACQAYEKVNNKNRIKTPAFLNVETFNKLL